MFLTNFITQNVNMDRINHARLVYDELRKELWYIFTSKTGNVNDSALIFDFTESPIKSSYENRGEYFNAAWRQIGSDGFAQILFGGSDGNVRFSSENRSIDAISGYLSELQYPDTDFKFADDKLSGIQKRFDMLEIDVLTAGSCDLGAEMIIDGQSVITKTAVITSGNAIFDSSTFDAAVFGGIRVLKYKVPIEAVGNQFSVRLFNSGINEDFAIANLRVYMKPLGDTYEA
jgi:hypothetical protein